MNISQSTPHIQRYLTLGIKSNDTHKNHTIVIVKQI